METKAIIISIKPKYVAKILSGEKTIEVRKRFPENYKGWVYIYCTKGHDKDTPIIMWKRPNKFGKVVARFYCDKVDRQYMLGKLVVSDKNDFLKNACLTKEELNKYLGYGKTEYMYAIHISQLEIFDKPKELIGFYKLTDDYYWDGKWYHNPLTKAPQSWCYIVPDAKY